MNRIFCVALVLLVWTGKASAAPITPVIDAHLINFATDLIYDTNGVDPDTLISLDDGSGGEATAWWPGWPTPGAPTSLTYDTGLAGSIFGSEVEMAIEFDKSDFVPDFLPFPQVSLTGTGLAPKGVSDFTVTGTIGGAGGPNVALWEIDVAFATLYGYSDFGTYTFEALGTIVGGLIPSQSDIEIGSQAVIRGFVTLSDLAFEEGYTPEDLLDPGSSFGVVAGQTGLGFVPPGATVPEPSSFVLLLTAMAGIGLVAVRRRKQAS